MFTKFKQAVVSAITLADAIRENTKALREHSAALLTKTSTIEVSTIDSTTTEQATLIAKIAEHMEYLATSELHKLRRAGQTHVFKS